MKIAKTERHITAFFAKEGDRWLAFEIENGELKNFDSNLPYQKSLEDWEFYGKAIIKIVKEWKKHG